MTIAEKDPEALTQQVFISYSNENETDLQVADKIYGALKARGIPCWVAHRDIAAGQKWPTEISKAISNSRVMIVVLSEHTQKSSYVEMEVTQAAEENLTIIPFCIGKVSLSAGGLKLLLGNCQWINAYPNLHDQDLDRLVETLQSYLGIEPRKTFKSVEKQPDVDKESSKPLWLKRVLVAASIIIVVIAAVFFIGQWIPNPGTTPVKKTTEVTQQKTGTKTAEGVSGNTETIPLDIKQANTTPKSIVKKETTKLPVKNKTDKKEKIEVPAKEKPDFISDLKSKGWDIEKNENGFWEAFYKTYDLTMIYIPPGKFKMGADNGDKDEKPAHEVDLDGYWIGKYEVTFAQYDRYCEETGKKKPGDNGWGREKRPVIYVSWNDADAYCKWFSKKTGLTFKLPTEAQWEKAARGTKGSVYPWGNNFDKNKCNSSESWLKKTMPVGTYPTGKSPYGIMDMAGNVWEWCADWYDNDYYKKSPDRNPQGPASGSYRVLRGGSWNNQSGLLRCAARNYAVPWSSGSTAGFALCVFCPQS